MNRRGASGLAVVLIAAVSLAISGCNMLNSPNEATEQASDAFEITDEITATATELAAEADPELANCWYGGCHIRCRLHGEFDVYKPTWEVDAEAEFECAERKVGGSRVKMEGAEICWLGEVEIKISAAWEWREGSTCFSRMGSRRSAKVLTDKYVFSVDPYGNLQGVNCEYGVVKAKAEATLESEADKTQKMYGEIVGGEVLDRGNGILEQFIIVKIVGGMGETEEASGWYMFHGVIDVPNGKIIKAGIYGIAKMPCGEEELNSLT